MNIKRWIYNLRHLNLIENNFLIKIQKLDDEKQHIIRGLTSQLSAVKEGSDANFNKLKNENEKLRSEILYLSDKICTLKSILKYKKIIPLKVVFLCEHKSLWKSFSSLVENLSKDTRFEVIVINLWCKEYSNDGSYCYTNPHIECLCKNENIKVIDSYDVKNDSWINLKKIEPDYVFFNRPYDYYRNENYHIKNIAKYSKTCYIPYGMVIIGGDVEKFTFPENFCSKLYFLFLNSIPLEKNSIDVFSNLKKLPNLDDEHLLYLGYPGLDNLKNKVDTTVNCKSKKFNILWLPRWNTSEGNCNFFDYKDILLQYVKKYKNSCCLIFRPHPLCFSNFIKTGEMSQDELDDFKSNFINEDVAKIDESGNYTDTFLESDVLVADETSLIAEYFVTKKPIIFCQKISHFSSLMKTLVGGLYVVKNKNELLDTLNFLRNGNDPLKEKRKYIIDKYLLNYGESAAENIKNALISDATENSYEIEKIKLQ